MRHRRSEAEIAELRRIADECDYDPRTIAARLHVAYGTVIGWAYKGLLTERGVTLLRAKKQRARERFRQTMEKCGGDAAEAAKVLGVDKRTVAGNAARYGVPAGARREMRPARRCCICFREFRNSHPLAVTCSPECKQKRDSQQKRRWYAQRHGLEYDPSGPIFPRDALEPKYQTALWDSFGNVRMAARALGCSEGSMYQNIRRWGMKAFVARARASAHDPDRLLELIKQCDWNLGKVCRENRRKTNWVRRMAAQADALHLVTHAPCLECGKMCPRRWNHRSTCSEECRIIRGLRLGRKRDHRRRANAGIQAAAK